MLSLYDAEDQSPGFRRVRQTLCQRSYALSLTVRSGEGVRPWEIRSPVYTDARRCSWLHPAPHRPSSRAKEPGACISTRRVYSVWCTVILNLIWANLSNYSSRNLSHSHTLIGQLFSFILSPPMAYKLKKLQRSCLAHQSFRPSTSSCLESCRHLPWPCL